MKRNTSNKLLIMLCLLLVVMAGCKAKKQLTAVRKADSASTTANSTVRSAVNQIRTSQLSFNTFSGKAAAKLAIGDKSNNVTLNIRIASGKKIWISVTALLGLEVARAVVTPDSILIVDKFDGTYIKKPFSFIYTYANKQVTYKMLESFFVGNAAPELLRDDVTIKSNVDAMELSGNLEQLVYKLVVGPDKRADVTNIQDLDAHRSLEVVNHNFVHEGDRTIPSDVVIQSVADNRKITLGWHYNRTDFNLPLEYPFSIPEDYKPQN